MRARQRTAILGIVATMAFVMMATGCGKGENAGGEKGGSEPKAGGTAVTAKPGALNAKIGAVFPLSGATATYGEEALGGLKMAIAELNGKDDINVDLVFKDNKGDSTDTAKLVTQLIKVDGVHAVIGSVASTNTLKGAKVAQENGIPLMTPASTNADITKRGEFISRICFIDPVQGASLAKLAFNDLKKKKAVMIVDKGSDYSVGLAKSFRETFTAAGGEIVSEESFTAGEADHGAMITKVAASGADVIYVPAYYGDVGPMLKQAGDKWKDMPIVSGDGIDSPDFYKLMGDYQGDIYMSTHFAPDDTDEKVQGFVKKYKAKYGKTPGAMAALGYDSGFALFDALKRAKSTEPGKLKDALNSIKDLHGITGSITINKERNADKDVVILKVSPAGAKFYKRITPK